MVRRHHKRDTGREKRQIIRCIGTDFAPKKLLTGKSDLAHYAKDKDIVTSDASITPLGKPSWKNRKLSVSDRYMVLRNIVICSSLGW